MYNPDMPRPPKSWLITDTHFNHAHLMHIGARPADYQAQILRNWGRLVLPQDTIYHLGDVILGQASQLPAILGNLPGRKVLIKGNHDLNTDNWYLARGFVFVAQGILTKGIWLTHAPDLALPGGAWINIHGHLHGDEHRAGEVGKLPAWCKLLALEDPAVNYCPVDMMEFAGMSKEAQMIME
jgi:calcineurin-like phosphoesterase family protein